ncbi:MAG: hypothetical protein M3Q84_04545 [Actinomycetota bacterium]|nr:hypothetical protein [Actinomycetota bacterium]
MLLGADGQRDQVPGQDQRTEQGEALADAEAGSRSVIAPSPSAPIPSDAQVPPLIGARTVAAATSAAMTTSRPVSTPATAGVVRSSPTVRAR